MIEPIENSKEKNQESDINEIKELLEDIDIFDTSNQSIKRRPIKLILKDDDERQRNMKNLYKLKSMGYLRISVTDDFTINERKKIKEMHENAKKKNTECDDGDFIWRVRGSPRTYLHLKKIPRNRSADRNMHSLTSVSSVSSTDEELPQND